MYLAEHLENIMEFYSVIILPPQPIIKTVKEMKDELASRIGLFNSRNSDAHLTICEFMQVKKSCF
ncbi:MAG: 2-5 ligase [Sphingobacteriales bacterium]|nr:2-5 ligase [Sphingobacteriales bacterium]